MTQNVEPCSSPEARAFDFWIGDWTIQQKILRQDGTWFRFEAKTSVAPTLDGCAILEHWEEGVARGPDPNGVYQVISWSKGKELCLEFTDLTLRAVESWLEVRPKTRDNKLFINIRRAATEDDPELRYRALRYRPLTKDIESIFKAAGVPVYRSHAIRHYVGHLYYERYGPKVAAMKLGHADAETTAATATAYYHKPRRDIVSVATAALRPAVLDEEGEPSAAESESK